MTDQLDDLFRDLRADTLTTVRPPGAAAARRTLRRRRTTRTVGAAACLAVAGIGGVGAHLLGPVATPDVGDRPEQAAAAVGSTATARFDGHGAAKSAMVASGVVLAGRYTLALSCVGRGGVTLTIRVNGAELGQATARCGDGRVSRQYFALADTLTATAELTAEDGAAGHAGYAYTMTLMDADRERLVADVVAALPATQGTVVYRSNGPLTGSTTETTALDPGRYRLMHTCTGTGQVSVTLRTPQDEKPARAECDRYATPGRMSFDILTSSTMSIEITPDPEAERQSAYALLLERY